MLGAEVALSISDAHSNGERVSRRERVLCFLEFGSAAHRPSRFAVQIENSISLDLIAENKKAALSGGSMRTH